MDSSVDPAYIENLLDDFRIACKTLDEIGYHSLVLVATEDRHIEIGSQRGRSFLEDNDHLIQEFFQYCQDGDSDEAEAPTDEEKPNIKIPESELDTGKTMPAHRQTQKSPRFTVVTADHQKTSSESVEESDDLKEDDSDDGDSVLSELDNEDDFDNDEYEIEIKPDDSVKGQTETRTKIVVVKNNRHAGKKATSANSNDSKSKTSNRKAAVKKSATPKNRSTSEQRKTFDCDLCNKKYARQEDLTVHQRKHTGEAPYICEVCKKAFRSKGLLRSHSIVHSRVRPYVCETCGQQFARQTNLKRHESTQHSDIVPYTCATCGKNFKDPSVYRLHQMRHSKQKPYHCETCGQQFLCSYLLSSHRLIHTGEKPFKCDSCDAKFRTKRFLTLHAKRMHSSKQIIFWEAK